jgi:peroxiredoxin
VGVRPFGISRDSVWSHAAFLQTLGIDNVPLLSDWNGDVVRAFDVAVELRGMRDVASRSAFLIEDGGTIRAAWEFDPRGVPDIDAVIGSVRS